METRIALWASSPVLRMFPVLLLSVVVPAVQLPPEIQADRHLLEAEKEIRERDFKGAKTSLDRILSLQVHHDLELPAEFFFRYAEVSNRLSLYEEAIQFVTKYLTLAGRAGQYYRAALELLSEAEAAAEVARKRAKAAAEAARKRAEEERKRAEAAAEAARKRAEEERKRAEAAAEAARKRAEEERKRAEAAAEAARKRAEEERKRAEAAAEAARKRAEEERKRAQSAVAAGAVPTCAGQAEGSGCWMELESRPVFCYVWNGYLEPDETVTWTGECSGGLAQGTGTLTWVWDRGQETIEATGFLQDGKRHGDWALRYADGRVQEGPYVDGKRHGNWVARFPNGEVREGPVLDGQVTGDWVFRFPDGRLAEGPVVDNKQQGDWVIRYSDGDVWEGPYLDGKRHGDWIIRDKKGRVWGGGSYEEGHKQGRWLERNSKGKKSKYKYVNGKQVYD